MKNLLVFLMFVLSITSCSKDSIDQGIVNFTSIEKSEIFVSVSYLSWADTQCEPGCVVSTNQMVTKIENARVELYMGSTSDTDAPLEPMRLLNTDNKGTVLFQDIEPGQYTVFVDTPLGQRSRTFYTQLNKRSSIDFSF